ncbi:MAG: hypothetical protein ACW967_01985 [Candidatus Hodarchaeales archaeon]|jgi:hypothetical protein
MANDDTVTYNLDSYSFHRGFLKNYRVYYSKDSWEILTGLLSFFGVESSEKRLFLKWHNENPIQMALLLKLLSKLVQGNILATYDKKKVWTLYLR